MFISAEWRVHNEKVNVEGSNLGPAVAYISAFGWSDHQIQPTTPAATVHTPMYVVGSKSFRPDQLFKVTEIKQLCYFST